MKNLVTLSCTALLAIGSAAVFADDVNMADANRLVEEGKIQSFKSLDEKAMSLQQGTITETDLEQEAGRYVYKVEMRTAEGREWDIELDASNAEVLKNKQDD
ncbi:MAG TPA: peptidase [Pseudomonas xinjiangensis]|uniref:Peptidase n=2 Tax=root TaxID=1 RepID=A0A7V1BR53_9GAMM|nr:peptidase [Halopseudomonas xinjiangensis]HEC48829.1 peptidase [Halopseudomonas xinjiangensis]